MKVIEKCDAQHNAMNTPRSPRPAKRGEVYQFAADQFLRVTRRTEAAVYFLELDSQGRYGAKRSMPTFQWNYLFFGQPMPFAS